MKRLVALVALGAVAMLGVGPCPAGCTSTCKALLQKCSVACPVGVTGVVGYEGAKAFCDDNPDSIGCSNLPQ
jgi:hypothetical protein